MARSSAESAGRAPEVSPGSEWLSQQVEALAAAWERGERITAEAWLARVPGLDTEGSVRLIYEELCLRREAGLDVKTSEVIRRFPQWRNELEMLLDADRLLRPWSGSTVFPQCGAALGSFQLRAELGRGASGVTFLATEPTLADRTVVLKVIPSDQQEHLALARLQHTHIVPLFSEHVFPEQGLRALCMPYLGGASLARVLSGLSDMPPGQRRGRHLVEVIDRVDGKGLAPPTSDSPFRRFFDQATYEQAIMLIAACLADALHYAHARGLVHMDIKPSNVLITGDGQPMLLDFHLARGPVAPGASMADRLGGTRGWMAPEQAEAMRAIGQGRPVAKAVDQRADLYALGLLLREALGCSVTTDGVHDSPPPSLRDSPVVSVGLADMIDKCLAPDPVDRYLDAASLADDLRRHINDLPLHGVANRGLAERWRKWRRRRPGALASGLALVTVLAAAAVAGSAFRLRVHQIESALKEGRTFREGRQYTEAIHALKRGLESAAPVPGVGPLTQALDEQLGLARRGQMATELHELADLIRFRFGIALPSNDEATTLSRHCQAIWEQRGLLVGPVGAALDSETEGRIKTDLMELALVWAELRVRRAAPDTVAEARRDALRILDEAEATFGPSLALDFQRRGLNAGPGRDAPVSVPVPRTPWEHYDLGRSYLRSGRFQEAASEFQRTLDSRPQDFWSNFYEGLCAFRLGHYEDAIAAFRTCAALEPAQAASFYNRALAYEALNRPDQAWNDYGRALERDPDLAAALLNRGIISYQRARYREADRDFDRAVHAATDRATRGQAHFNRALVLQAEGDLDSALVHAEAAVSQGDKDAIRFRDDLRKGRPASRLPAR